MKEIKENKRTLVATQIDDPYKKLALTKKYTPL